METKTKIAIVKDSGVSYAKKQTCSADGTVLRSEQIDLDDAKQIIQKTNLSRESKTTSKSGATTYLYS